MHIITIDPLDGKGEIQMAVSSYVEAQRIQILLMAAKEALINEERYLKLRNAHWSDGGLIVTYSHNAQVGSDCPSGDRLDAVIDGE